LPFGLTVVSTFDALADTVTPANSPVNAKLLITFAASAVMAVPFAVMFAGDNVVAGKVGASEGASVTADGAKDGVPGVYGASVGAATGF